MQVWFNIWKVQGGSSYLYTKADIAAYLEDLECVTFLCDTPTHSPAWERVEALRKQVPESRRLPGAGLGKRVLTQSGVAALFATGGQSFSAARVAQSMAMPVSPQALLPYA